MTFSVGTTDAGLRFDDMKEVFLANAAFAATSAVAKRINAALDFLQRAFKNKGSRSAHGRSSNHSSRSRAGS